MPDEKQQASAPTNGAHTEQAAAPTPAPAPEPVRTPAPPPALTTAQALAEMEWLRVMKVTGSALFDSGLFGLQNVAQGLVVCIKARDLGVTPTYILDRFWPVTAGGRTTLMPKGDAVVAKFYERGGRITLKTLPTDRDECQMEVVGPASLGAVKVDVTYIIEDAKKENAKAFESDRGIWRTRPHRQLFRAAAKIGIGIVDPQTFVEIGEADEEFPTDSGPAPLPSLKEVRAEIVDEKLAEIPFVQAEPPHSTQPAPTEGQQQSTAAAEALRSTAASKQAKGKARKGKPEVEPEKKPETKPEPTAAGRLAFGD